MGCCNYGIWCISDSICVTSVSPDMNGMKRVIVIPSLPFLLALLAKGHVSFCHHLASIILLSVLHRKLSNLNLLLWNHWTKPGRYGHWVDPFQNCVWQSRWLLLLKIYISSIVHYCFCKSKCASNFKCSYIARVV